MKTKNVTYSTGFTAHRRDFVIGTPKGPRPLRGGEVDKLLNSLSVLSTADRDEVLAGRGVVTLRGGALAMRTKFTQAPRGLVKKREKQLSRAMRKMKHVGADKVGFGLMPLRGEGQAMHPDDPHYPCDATDEQYLRQLQAYKDWSGEVGTCSRPELLEKLR